ncbi:hypothetical protein J6590_106763, partial [Homalodisca vitripennis]
ENIMKRWVTIRDGFMRSVKPKTGQSAKKKYVYSEHLNFLLKIAQKEDTTSSYSTTNAKCGEEVDSEPALPSPVPSVWPTECEL